MLVKLFSPSPRLTFPCWPTVGHYDKVATEKKNCWLLRFRLMAIFLGKYPSKELFSFYYPTSIQLEGTWCVVWDLTRHIHIPCCRNLHSFRIVKFLCSDGLFQQDNTAFHRERLTEMSFYKHSDNVHVLHWSTCLPDFNLTEHAGGVLQTSKLLDTSNNSTWIYL